MDRLHYICRQTDTVKDVESTRDRQMNVSGMFYRTRRDALVDLKEILTQRINTGICSIMEIERELANIDRT